MIAIIGIAGGLLSALCIFILARGPEILVGTPWQTVHDEMSLLYQIDKQRPLTHVNALCHVLAIWSILAFFALPAVFVALQRGLVCAVGRRWPSSVLRSGVLHLALGLALAVPTLSSYRSKFEPQAKMIAREIIVGNVQVKAPNGWSPWREDLYGPVAKKYLAGSAWPSR